MKPPLLRQICKPDAFDSCQLSRDARALTAAPFVVTLDIRVSVADDQETRAITEFISSPNVNSPALPSVDDYGHGSSGRLAVPTHLLLCCIWVTGLGCH